MHNIMSIFIVDETALFTHFNIPVIEELLTYVQNVQNKKKSLRCA